MGEPFAMRNPALPGRVVITSTSSFPAHKRRGWVEAKSAKAKAAVDNPPSPPGEIDTSQEDDK